MENLWSKSWRVIDLLELVKEIGGLDYRNHDVYKEWEYQIENGGRGNDLANLEWVGDNEKTPIINKFLLSNGFKKGEKVLFWVCW